MIIDLIDMPLNLGANKRGVESGYSTLKERLKLQDIFHAHTLNYVEEISIPSFEEISADDDMLMKNKQAIFAADTRLGDIVYHSLSQNHFPLVVGGDHALSWGSISGVTKFSQKTGCVYIDAHGDFNLAEMSPSHNVHGMHMAYLMGLTESPDVDFYEKGIKLNPQDVFFVATRSLDWGEKELSDKYHLNIRTSAEIRRQGIEQTAQALLKDLLASDCQRFHLSFDIDAIDPSFAPGTGVPEADGITSEEAIYLLNVLLRSGLFISMDFVEFNPLLDKENRTLSLCSDILKTINSSLE